MSNVTVNCVCPTCCKVSAVVVDENTLNEWHGGKNAQDAFPDMTAFDRELLISGMCHACQSKLYNVPMPNEDWGEIAGYCPDCDTTLWVNRNMSEGGRYVCPTCGGSFNADELLEE